jgi:exosortase B
LTDTIDQKVPAWLLEWWPILLGISILYFPTFRDLYSGSLHNEALTQGLIILIVIFYLFWEKRWVLLRPAQLASPLSGGLLLAFGLLLFILGRTQDILLFEIGSILPVLAGILLIVRGVSALKTLWFALFFSLFMIPLPGSMVDFFTASLKQVIANIAENVLYAFGYPVARSGAIITIGHYQLLVADACSGLHSMFSLSALGLLYLYLVRHKSWWRNGIIVASILPMAFFANVVRVMILILITYHFGDEAGQGFIHSAAGIVLFAVALVGLFILDWFLGLVGNQIGFNKPSQSTKDKSAP